MTALDFVVGLVLGAIGSFAAMGFRIIVLSKDGPSLLWCIVGGLVAAVLGFFYNPTFK